MILMHCRGLIKPHFVRRHHNERLQIELDKVQSEFRTIASKETALVVKHQCLQEELQVAKDDVALFKVIPQHHPFLLVENCFCQQERVEVQSAECSNLNLEFSKLKVCFFHA